MYEARVDNCFSLSIKHCSIRMSSYILNIFNDRYYTIADELQMQSGSP